MFGCLQVDDDQLPSPLLGDQREVATGFDLQRGPQRDGEIGFPVGKRQNIQSREKAALVRKLLQRGLPELPSQEAKPRPEFAVVSLSQFQLSAEAQNTTDRARQGWPESHGGAGRARGAPRAPGPRCDRPERCYLQASSASVRSRSGRESSQSRMVSRNFPLENTTGTVVPPARRGHTAELAWDRGQGPGSHPTSLLQHWGGTESPDKPRGLTGR